MGMPAACASLIAVAAGSRLSMLRLTRETLAPASARARATPPVMPVPPPVTKATRSFNIPSAKIVIIGFCNRQRFKSTACDEGSRLHDVKVALHISPFDVLIFATEDFLDIAACRRQAPDNRIGQHCTFIINRDFSDSAVLVKR